SIAAALAIRPQLLILDEPVTDLDLEARDTLAAHLAALGEGMSVVCFDVELRPWMTRFCEAFYRLEKGRLHGPLPPEAFDRSLPALPLLPAGSETRLKLSGVGFSHVPARPLLAGVDLSLPCGAVAAVTGPNGAGKTTLMRLIAGLARPHAGDIR